MSLPQKFGVFAAYLLILVGIGTADAVLTGDGIVLPIIAQNARSSNGDARSEEGGNASTGVAKNEGPDIFRVLEGFSIATQTTREESLLRRVIPQDVPVESRVLLQNDDRIAFFSWVESPDVKTYFTALKEALHASFSDQVQDLIDEEQEDPEKTTRFVLSFFDPAIHEERLLFVRIRQRLYEFHVVDGKEGQVEQVMDSLTE